MSANVQPLSEFDAYLRERFLNATDIPCEVHWEDVERRARQLGARHPRRLTRRRLAVAALVVLAIAVAAPALGIDRAVIDFLSADKAPKVVRVDFRHWFDEVPLEQRRPGVVPDEARKVHTFTAESGSYVLYMSPARDGYCWSLRGVAGACETRNSRIISPLWSDIWHRSDPTTDPLLITGPINDTRADRLVLTFQDGTRIDLPFVVISRPIDAGFFYYEVPKERWKRGLRPLKLTVYGPNNRVLGESPALVYEEGR
jgi:hypothetical protein